MPPVNTIVVQTVLLPPGPGRNSVSSSNACFKALEPVNAALEGEYVIGDFSAADIMLGHACFMSNRLGCVGEDVPHLKLVLNASRIGQRLKQRLRCSNRASPDWISICP